jgi:hypothetical protein
MNRPDLVHPFVYEWVHGNRCCHWYEWLGGFVRCQLPENDPIHLGETTRKLPMVAEHCRTVKELGEWMRLHGHEEYPISEELARLLKINARPVFRLYEAE